MNIKATTAKTHQARDISAKSPAPRTDNAATKPSIAQPDVQAASAADIAALKEKDLGVKAVHATKLLVSIEGGGSVALDPKTGSVTKSIATGPNGFGALFSRDGTRAFVTDKGQAADPANNKPEIKPSLQEIDVATGAILAKLEFAAVSDAPQQPAITKDGRLFIPMAGTSSVAVIDTNNGLKKLRDINIGAGTKPHIVSLSPDGKDLYATVQGNDPKVVQIGIEANGEKLVKETRFNLVPRVCFATNDGVFFTAHHSTGLHYVGNKADSKPYTIFMDVNGRGSEPAKQIEGVSASADGRFVAFTHEGRKSLVILERKQDLSTIKDANDAIDAFKLKKDLDNRQRGLSAAPYWVSFDPSGKLAYVSIPGSGTVEAHDLTASGEKPLWRASVGGKPKRMDATAGG